MKQSKNTTILCLFCCLASTNSASIDELLLMFLSWDSPNKLAQSLIIAAAGVGLILAAQRLAKDNGQSCL
jgi:hypothetical protein